MGAGVKSPDNEPKAVKFFVGVAVILVSAIVVGVISALATTFVGGQSDAGRPCPDKAGRYLRRFAGATLQPTVTWSGCKIGSSGLVLRASFDLEDSSQSVLAHALDSRGFRSLSFEGYGVAWSRRTSTERTMVFKYDETSLRQYAIVHAESGVR